MEAVNMTAPDGTEVTVPEPRVPYYEDAGYKKASATQSGKKTEK
jgi:hypothetical protein|nr:MAG TPA: hypothetical protein [Caudoviricetes sp.]